MAQLKRLPPNPLPSVHLSLLLNLRPRLQQLPALQWHHHSGQRLHLPLLLCLPRRRLRLCLMLSRKLRRCR
jgi:hypothetical protein